MGWIDTITLPFILVPVIAHLEEKCKSVMIMIRIETKLGN